MRRALPVVVLALLVLVTVALFDLVSEPGTMRWDEGNGRLELGDPGLTFQPFWGEAQQLRADISASQRLQLGSGLRVDLEATLKTVKLRGIEALELGPARDPQRSLQKLLADRALALLGPVDSGCLAPVLDRGEPCPDELEGRIAAGIAASLGIDSAAVLVSFEVDPEAVRAIVLGRMAQSLPAPRSRVFMLGLDAFDWRFIVPLVEAGKMPNLRRLMRAGTWGELEAIQPLLSPLIWTSIATGVSSDLHGILDFVERDPSGELLPITGRSRRFPAIWNLATAFGRRSDVVGWWATWPAEDIAGTMVSDRLYHTLNLGNPRAQSIDPPRMVWPETELDTFVELREAAHAATGYDELQRFLPRLSRARWQEGIDSGVGMEDPVDGLRRIVASTRTYLGAGLMLAEREQELLVVYLEGTDTIGHLLAPYLPPPRIEGEAAIIADSGVAIERYFANVDAWIGRYLKLLPLDTTTWILASDHGFRWGADRPKGLSGVSGPTAPMWHVQIGAYLVAGKAAAARGHSDAPAHVYDVAPSLAALLGLPPDERWSGSVLPGIEANPLPAVDHLALVPPSSYQARGVEGATQIDEEQLAKLQALGYLGGGQSAGGTSLDTPTAARPTAVAVAALPTPASSALGDAPLTRGQLNNLGLVKLNAGHHDEAELLFRQAIAMDVSYSGPHYNLRRLYVDTGRYDEADVELLIAVDKGLRDPERSIDRAAADWERLDQPERAARLLDQGIQRFGEHEPFYVHLMVVKMRGGDCGGALEVGRQTDGRFDTAPVHAFYGLAAACAGELTLARREIERSLEINPEQARLISTLEQLGGE